MTVSSVDKRSTLLRVAWWVFVLCAALAALWLIAETWGFVRSLPESGWDIRLMRILGSVLLNSLFATSIATIVALYLWGRMANSLPDLKGWHTDRPQSEFSAADAVEGYTFADYMEQERQVFQELDALISGPWKEFSQGEYSRFDPKSLCYPNSIDTHNWNQSLVMDAPAPIGGVLLIHGLSDAPYSLRTLGKRLHGEGYTVMWLRVPGHGTCPNALAHVSWEDWIAAVQLAMRSLRDRVPPGTPLVLGGYSNGGALSVYYTLQSMQDSNLPQPSAVTLFSPMIGINPMARITRLYHFVGLIFRNQKAHWSNIAAEIDPFKYTSWPMNGNVQAWTVTKAIEQRLASLHKAGRMSQMPPVLAMQSVVDSTVAVPKLISVLFNRLRSKNNELFLFDVNRNEKLANLVNLSFERTIVPQLRLANASYELKVLRNTSKQSHKVALVTFPADTGNVKETEMVWPDGVVSLSHVALPFPPDDAVYGTKDATSQEGPQLGSLSMRAEPSALMIPTSLFARCRHNPFYQFMEDYVADWLSRVTAPHD